jgi:hypothetical protein
VLQTQLTTAPLDVRVALAAATRTIVVGPCLGLYETRASASAAQLLMTFRERRMDSMLLEMGDVGPLQPISLQRQLITLSEYALPREVKLLIDAKPGTSNVVSRAVFPHMRVFKAVVAWFGLQPLFCRST